jgi:hypothetical protein
VRVELLTEGGGSSVRVLKGIITGVATIVSSVGTISTKAAASSNQFERTVTAVAFTKAAIPGAKVNVTASEAIIEITLTDGH